MDFSPLAALPGWEATDGRFAALPCGHLRFVRWIRRRADCCAMAVVTLTPREAEAAIAALGAELAAQGLVPRHAVGEAA